MKIYCRKTFSLSLFVILSLLLHGIAGYILARFGRYDFARPVGDYSLDIVEVTWGKEIHPGSERVVTVAPRISLLPAKPSVENDDSGTVFDGSQGRGHAPGNAVAAGTAKSEFSETGDDGGDTNGGEGEVDSTSELQGRVTGFTSFPQQRPLAKNETAQALGKIEALLAATQEKLSYQLSLYGLPVGGAVQEAASGGMKSASP